MVFLSPNANPPLRVPTESSGLPWKPGSEQLLGNVLLNIMG